MPEDRLRRYRSYFAAVGISGVARRDDAVILFMVDTTGMLTKGRYKGYAYLPAKAAKTYAQLDRASDGTYLDCNPHYKLLKDNWYLFVVNCID
jgi:hypothetical protein